MNERQHGNIVNSATGPPRISKQSNLHRRRRSPNVVGHVKLTTAAPPFLGPISRSKQLDDNHRERDSAAATAARTPRHAPNAGAERGMSHPTFPSHESVTTDLSLFSVSSATSDAHRRLLAFGKCESVLRGHSPNPDNRSQSRPADIPEILWFEEETELIRSCAALSSAVGLQKSFSTSDISQLPSPEDGPLLLNLRNAVSELALNSLQRNGFILENARLDQTSRSCSTWVAVGDIASTSQLPSPHGGHSSSTNAQQPASTPPPPAFTAADFIRSVNKKVRQNYIRRRLLTTYKALERLSQSEFNLDRLEVTPSTATASITNPETSNSITTAPSRLTVPGKGSSPTPSKSPTNSSSTNAAMLRVAKQKAGKNLPLTIRDVERERGKPLSKYERNMMIFNWLHTLDDTAHVEDWKQPVRLA